MNWPSALRPFTAASDSSRSTSPSSFWTSATVAWCLMRLPLCNKFSKLTAASFQEDLVVADDFEQERVSGLVLLLEARRGVQGGVDDATERLRRAVQRAGHFLEAYVADDQEVDIAVANLFPPGDGTEDEREGDPVTERRQGSA